MLMSHITVPNEQIWLDITNTNGAGPFPFVWPYQLDADIHLYLNGVFVPKSEFIVTPGPIRAGGYENGSVSLNTPLISTDVLRIIRDPSAGRLIDLGINGLRPDDINSELDRIHMILMTQRYWIEHLKDEAGLPATPPGADAPPSGIGNFIQETI